MRNRSDLSEGVHTLLNPVTTLGALLFQLALTALGTTRLIMKTKARIALMPSSSEHRSFDDRGLAIHGELSLDSRLILHNILLYTQVVKPGKTERTFIWRGIGQKSIAFDVVFLEKLFRAFDTFHSIRRFAVVLIDYIEEIGSDTFSPVVFAYENLQVILIRIVRT